MPPLHRSDFAFTRDLTPLNFGQRFIDFTLLAFGQPTGSPASRQMEKQFSSAILFLYRGLTNGFDAFFE